MKKLLLLPLLLLGCASTTNKPTPYDLNYDQRQQYEVNQRQVDDEFDRRDAESYDSQTQSDIDKAVERNR
jgi:hypothetical protein